MLSVRLLDTSCHAIDGCEAARTVFVRLNDSAVAGLVGSARGGVQLNDARSVVTAIVEGGIVFGAAVDHQVVIQGIGPINAVEVFEIGSRGLIVCCG